jgi:L-asparaginase
MDKNIHDEILLRLENTGYLIPCSKDEIKVALEAFNDDQRAQNALDIIRKIWTSFSGLGVCPVLEQVYYEEGEHNFYEKYRDHIVHTLELYLLGLDMVNSLPELKERVFSGLNQNELKKLWAAVALSHDQGYIMEITERLVIPPKIQKLLKNPILDVDFGFPSSNIKNELGGYINVPDWPSSDIMDIVYIILDNEKVNILEKMSNLLPQNLVGRGKNDLGAYFDLKKITEHQVWDHGITSMLLFQQFYNRLKAQLSSLVKSLDKIDILEEDEKKAIRILEYDLNKSLEIVNKASIAIALHNIKKNFAKDDEETHATRKGLRLDKYQLSLSKTPLAWFLVFCDTLQEWNRPFARRIPGAGRNIHSPTGLSIEYDTKKQMALISFKNEIKFLKEKGESLFWKKRLDLIIVLNESDVDRYLGKGPKDEMGFLKLENKLLIDQIQDLKKPKQVQKKQKGENWYYMGVIDSYYPEDKLSQDITKTVNKYNEFEPVFVLYTGGTVGMVRENPMDPKSPIKTKSLEYVLPHLKRIEEIKNDIHFWELAPPLDSSNIGAKEWIEIARIIQKVYSYYQGFVILHGTDTMAYTASALSFILTNLSKPVILTGAEKPISEPVSDAEPNIVSAIQIASYKSIEKPCVPEVCIFFGSRLIRGNRSKKVHSLALQGFDSPNCEPLGIVEDDIDINQKILISPGGGRKLNVDDRLYPGVAIFEIYPNNEACLETLRFILKQDHIRGLILKTYGTGNAPTAPDEYLEIIKKALDKGKIIVNLTNCPKGQVQVRLFETNARLFEHGVINGGDLTTEAALCKLMWLLGSKQDILSEGDIKTIKAKMQINFVGELRYSAFNLRHSDVHIPFGKHYIGEEQELQFFDNKAINHAYIRAQEIRVNGPPCDFELEFYYCYQRIEKNSRDQKQKFHCIDSIPRRWERQEEGITFNVDATPTVRKIREIAPDRYHSLSIIAKCDYEVSIKTLELAIFTENVRGVRE